MFSAEFLYADLPDTDGAHSASICALPNGGLAAVWYAYPEEETRAARIVIARRDPGGAWSKGRVVDLGGTSSLGNPLLFMDPAGVLWLHFITLKGHFWDSGIWCVARSNDMGATFAPPSVVCHQAGMMIRHAPILTAAGAALMPAYCERRRMSIVFTSNAPYTEWRETYSFGETQIIQGCFARAGNQINIFFRPFDEPFVSWRSASSDEGRTWSHPMRLSLPNPLSGIASFSLGDRIALVYNNSHNHKRYPLSISTSPASMNDWSVPRNVDDA
ncbi:MAG TPA: exo-alpha-sialidase, partial [candidate division Zixibacteria bacterium]|nr:exo-alpha-sialidase [candidate division Zixibacteria bacterium]